MFIRFETATTTVYPEVNPPLLANCLKAVTMKTIWVRHSNEYDASCQRKLVLFCMHLIPPLVHDALLVPARTERVRMSRESPLDNK